MPLTFEQIPYNSLVCGKKYKVLNDNNSSFDGCFNTFYMDSLEFKNTTLLRVNHTFFASIYFKNIDQYYVPITKKLVQQKMEKRSLHMILRKLIGDPHFEW